jgi:hypothetical protein
MAGALAEHAVKPQADEQGNQGKDDNDGQAGNPILFRLQHSARTQQIQSGATHDRGIAPHFPCC